MSAIPQTVTCPTSIVFADPSAQAGLGGDATCQTSGGSALNYLDNLNIVQTFATTNGQCITLSFSGLFPMGICVSDTLFFYDGSSTSSPALTSATLFPLGYLTNTTSALSGSVTTSGPNVTFKFVSNSDGHARGWRISFSCGSCPSSPLNDNYSGATALSVGSSCTYVTGTTYFANSSVTCSSAPTCTAGTPGNPDDDVWYTFTTGPSQVTATVAVDGISPTDPVVQVFSGTCGSFTQVACVNSNSGSGSDESTGAFTVSPSTTYYVRVYDVGSFVGSNNNTNNAFQICVTGGTQNDCAGASEVCSSSQISHTNTGGTGTQEYGTGTWGCLFGEHNTAWYTFKASASGTLSFNIASSNGSFQDIDWALWGPFASTGSICNLTPILSSSYAIGNANPGCGLPAYSTGLSSCETGGTNCEGAGGNGSVVAFNQPVSITINNYYALLVDIFSGNTSYYINWSLTNGGAIWNCLLPIEILSFDGKVLQDANYLHWSTSSEENNAYFVIERGIDTEQFDSIGVVTGVGTSMVQSDYHYYDSRPLAGRNYYRIRQVDHDGTFTHSAVIWLENTYAGFNIKSVYPNPTTGEVNIELLSEAPATVFFSLLDASGRIMMHNAWSAAEGNNRYTLNLSDYPQGIYYLGCQTADRKVKLFEKVVKN
jgi:hypothetical protein